MPQNVITSLSRRSARSTIQGVSINAGTDDTRSMPYSSACTLRFLLAVRVAVQRQVPEDQADVARRTASRCVATSKPRPRAPPGRRTDGVAGMIIMLLPQLQAEEDEDLAGGTVNDTPPTASTSP